MQWLLCVVAQARNNILNSANFMCTFGIWGAGIPLAVACAWYWLLCYVLTYSSLQQMFPKTLKPSIICEIHFNRQLCSLSSCHTTLQHQQSRVWFVFFPCWEAPNRVYSIKEYKKLFLKHFFLFYDNACTKDIHGFFWHNPSLHLSITSQCGWGVQAFRLMFLNSL